MSHKESEQKAEAYIKLLQDAINSEDQDDQEVIDIASQVLNFMPDDKDVLLCRAVAYMRNSPPQFQNALADLENVPNTDFEKCLCYYGLRRFEDALKFLKSLPADKQKEDRFHLLEEQILLSVDDSVQIRQFYSNLNLANATPEHLQNITCGFYVAGQVQEALQLLNSNAKIKKGSLYNLVCLLVMTKNYEKAQELIESALQRCKGKPMFLQLFLILKAEILTNSERAQEAIGIYESLVNNENSHQYIKQIAAANLTSLTVDTNIHQAKKLMSFYDNNDEYSHYRRTEIESYIINRFLILHKIGQPNKVKALIEFAKKQKNIDTLIPESLERTVDPTTSEISKYTPLFDAQNFISQSKYFDAAQVLMNSAEISRTPRGIAVISELLAAGNKKQEAIEFLIRSEASCKQIEAEFLDFAARYAYQIGAYEQGVKWSERLLKVTANSQRSCAIHCMLLAETDIEMAERYSGRIKYTVATDADLDEIEDKPTEVYQTGNAVLVPSDEDLVGAFNAKDGSKRHKVDKSMMSPEKLMKLKEKKKKRRRLQKPENYDPKRHMDPERWIKMKKRSANKKKPQKKGQPAQAKKAPGKPQKRGK